MLRRQSEHMGIKADISPSSGVRQTDQPRARLCSAHVPIERASRHPDQARVCRIVGPDAVRGEPVGFLERDPAARLHEPFELRGEFPVSAERREHEAGMDEIETSGCPSP
jgi:hypothetical protein